MNLNLIQVMKMSSKKNLGLDEVWEKLLSYKSIMLENDELHMKRSQQQKIWMWQYIQYSLLQAFNNDSSVKNKRKHYEDLVTQGLVSPGTASDRLLTEFFRNKNQL